MNKVKRTKKERKILIFRLGLLVFYACIAVGRIPVLNSKQRKNKDTMEENRPQTAETG